MSQAFYWVLILDISPQWEAGGLLSSSTPPTSFIFVIHSTLALSVAFRVSCLLLLCVPCATGNLFYHRKIHFHQNNGPPKCIVGHHFHQPVLHIAHYPTRASIGPTLAVNNTVFLQFFSFYCAYVTGFCLFCHLFLKHLKPFRCRLCRQGPNNATAPAILHTFNISSMQVISVWAVHKCFQDG